MEQLHRVGSGECEATLALPTDMLEALTAAAGWTAPSLAVGPVDLEPCHPLTIMGTSLKRCRKAVDLVRAIRMRIAGSR